MNLIVISVKEKSIELLALLKLLMKSKTKANPSKCCTYLKDKRSMKIRVKQ